MPKYFKCWLSSFEQERIPTYNSINILLQEVIEQKQRAELAASEVIIAGLKEEIGDYERRLSTAEADTEALRQQVADKDRQIAEVEAQAR
jgi:hypothetical protein